MPQDHPTPYPPERGEPDFPDTPWSVLIQGNDGGGNSRAAWEELAHAYWQPLYIIMRRRGSTHHAAADDIQGFFAHLLSRDFLRQVERGDGLFRSFLLTALNRWRTDQHRVATAQKRGGGIDLVSLQELKDTEDMPIAYEGPPEDAFDRSWARAVYASALKTLQMDLQNRGRGPQFLKLRGLFKEGGTARYQEIGCELGMSEGAVKQAALEMRREFGSILRNEIRKTVATEEQVDEEIRYLLNLLKDSP